MRFLVLKPHYRRGRLLAECDIIGDGCDIEFDGNLDPSQGLLAPMDTAARTEFLLCGYDAEIVKGPAPADPLKGTGGFAAAPRLNPKTDIYAKTSVVSTRTGDDPTKVICRKES